MKKNYFFLTYIVNALIKHKQKFQITVNYYNINNNLHHH